MCMKAASWKQTKNAEHLTVCIKTQREAWAKDNIQSIEQRDRQDGSIFYGMWEKKQQRGSTEMNSGLADC